MPRIERDSRYRRKCQHCGAMYAVPNKSSRQRYCGMACWLRANPDHMRKVSDLGGAARRRKSLADFVDTLRLLGASDAVVGLALEKVRSIRISAHARGVEVGRRRGWREALGERLDHEGGRGALVIPPRGIRTTNWDHM